MSYQFSVISFRLQEGVLLVRVFLGYFRGLPLLNENLFNLFTDNRKHCVAMRTNNRQPCKKRCVYLDLVFNRLLGWEGGSSCVDLEIGVYTGPSSAPQQGI